MLPPLLVSQVFQFPPTHAAPVPQIPLFLSLLQELDWPYAIIMENVNGLLSGARACVCMPD